MKTGNYISRLVIMICGLFLTACLLPGMIPLNRQPAGPMPTMEKDSNKLIETLNSNNYVTLEQLAQERYTAKDLAKPGTWTFTVKLTEQKPVFFSYGWCTTTQEILKQNFEHITVNFYFNDEKLGKDVVHPLSLSQPNGMVCQDYGVLLSDWPAGKYTLKAVATFDQKINDGTADYDAGDYVFDYNVTVDKGQGGSQTSAPSP